MSDRPSYIPKEIVGTLQSKNPTNLKDWLEEQSANEIFRNRFVIFIIAVAALIAAFAWNHLAVIGIRDRIDADPLRAALLYAIIMTILFVVIIFIVAVIYKKVYGF